MGVFFATARVTHLVPAQFFGMAFWIGFSINVFAFELWIRSADGRRSSQTPVLVSNPVGDPVRDPVGDPDTRSAL